MTSELTYEQMERVQTFLSNSWGGGDFAGKTVAQMQRMARARFVDSAATYEDFNDLDAAVVNAEVVEWCSEMAMEYARENDLDVTEWDETLDN